MSMPISRYMLPRGFIHLRAFFAISRYAPKPSGSAYRAFLGSCMAPLLTRVSPRAMYGGLDTIISKRSDTAFARLKDLCIIFMRSFNPSACTLRRATRTAPRDMSSPIPVAPGIFFTSAAIIHPDPVPKSRIFGACALSAITASTSVSVSGRGSRVCRFV